MLLYAKNMEYSYPQYNIDLTAETLAKCADLGARLAGEVGVTIRNEKFLAALKGKPGIRIDGVKIYPDERIIRANIEKYRSKLRANILKDSGKPAGGEWRLACGGFSMMVRDIATDEIRLATRQDLRDLIRLVNSYGLGGNYPVMPQDLPPLMRALDCFKICWESADNIRPYDYLHRSQTPFIHEMHKIMGKPFSLTLCIVQPLTLDEHDVDVFLDFYPVWKKERNINFQVLNYPMMGITKPVTLTGSVIMYIAELFGLHAVFNAFDPELELPVHCGAGMLTDLRNACWAFGHPRQHLLHYLNSRIPMRFAGVEWNRYVNGSTLLETASSALDEQCGLEKMATGLMAALQGARSFTQLGNICVDDLFSGTQFVIDVEMVNYIRELIEAFDPPRDIISLDDETYASLKEVCLGNDQFISACDTAAKFRNIMPSSSLLVREKLRSWMDHRKTLQDRAKEQALERIQNFQPTFHLPADKQKALDEIYARAEKALKDIKV